MFKGLLISVAILATSLFDYASAQVLYGQMIVLRHTETGQHLYSSSTPYSHVNSSQQNQVVGVEFLDTSCRWRVLPATGVELRSVDGKPVRDADVIRLQHINTYKLLHSHTIPAPVSSDSRQEVSGFNEQEDNDVNDNWIVRVLAPVPGQPWTNDVGVRLMHQATGAKLYSEMNAQHPNYTSNHQEVAASLYEPEELHQNYEWMAVKVNAACSGYSVDSCIRSDDDGTGGKDGNGVSKEEFQKFLAIFNQWDEERFKQMNDDPNNTPKEISIYCPVNPNVNIQELDYSMQANGDCMVLNIQSPHLEAKLSLKCSEKKDDSSSSSSSSSDDGESESKSKKKRGGKTEQKQQEKQEEEEGFGAEM